jgi:hypothetical protein
MQLRLFQRFLTAASMPLQNRQKVLLAQGEIQHFFRLQIFLSFACVPKPCCAMQLWDIITQHFEERITMQKNQAFNHANSRTKMKTNIPGLKPASMLHRLARV